MMTATRVPLRLLDPSPARPLPPAVAPGVRRLDTTDAGVAERKSLYKTSEWGVRRAEFLRQNPVCSCGSPATVVDHIEGHGEGWESRFWDDQRWQALCVSCHNAKSAREHAVAARPIPTRGRRTQSP